jgi:hypothetical protein
VQKIVVLLNATTALKIRHRRETSDVQELNTKYRTVLGKKKMHTKLKNLGCWKSVALKGQ